MTKAKFSTISVMANICESIKFILAQKEKPNITNLSERMALPMVEPENPLTVEEEPEHQER